MQVTTNLWDHQKEAVEWLKQNGSGILHMEMGTGKSLTTIKYLEQIYSDTNLIIAPKKALNVWRDELDEHTNGEYLLLNYTEGTVDERAKRIYEDYQDATNQAVFITVNYTAGLDYEPMRATLKHIDFDSVIFDEIHELKNPEGKRARQAFLIAENIPHRIGLTGTPMSNGILDLYQQLMIVRGKPYKNLSWWEDTFTDQDHWGNIKSYKNEDQARNILSDHSFQVGEEVLDLPDYTETKKYCQLSPSRQDEHDEEWRKVKQWLVSGEGDEDDITASITKCQQLANGPDKFNLFEDVYSNLNEPVVMFAKYHKDLDKLSDICDNYFELSSRHDHRDEWVDIDEKALFGIQIQAGKQSINCLTNTRYCGFLAPTYSYENWRQATKRIVRPGQDQEVRFFTLISENTIDEKAMNARNRKTNLVEEVVG